MSEHDPIPADADLPPSAAPEPADITDWADEPPPETGRLPLSLLTNLRALSEDMTPRRLRGVLAELCDRVERGESLDVALSAVRPRLPEGLVALLDVGLAHGRINLLLGSYLDHVRRRSDLRSAIWTSLTYPVLVVAVLLLLGLLVAVLIVPTFGAIFRDFDVELPTLTLVVVSVSRTIRDHGLMLLVGLAALLCLLWGALRLFGGPALPQQTFRSIPCIGRVYRWASLAGFTETLAMLVDLRAPLPQALRLAGQTTDDLTLGERAGRLAADLDAGVPLESAAEGTTRLGRELGGVLRWAGQPRLFADALRSSGEIFAARSRVELHLLTWLLEPLLLLAVAVSLGLCMVAMFLPLIKLLNDLS
jgi:type II secretory pathway component PulF